MKHTFTLLELLLVTVILGLIASTALLVVDHSDDQFRFEETKRRLQLIEQALLGKNSDDISGYLADTGQLPLSITDFTSKPAALNDWSFNSLLGFGTGWRGPYISTFDSVFKDGWGNEWQDFSTVSGFTVTSYGKDRELGASADYEDDISLNIAESRIQTESPIVIETEIINEGSSSINKDVKLFVLYPSEDLPASFSETWDEAALEDFLSNEQNLTVDAGESKILSFSLTLSEALLFRKARVLLVSSAESGTAISDKILDDEDNLKHINFKPLSYSNPKVTLRLD